MQHALILNRLIPEQDSAGRVCALNAVTHDGRSVRFDSDQQQRINVTTLEFQQTPLLILTDQLRQSGTEVLSVPSSALVAVVPIASEQIRTMLGAGQGDDLLRAVGDQLF